MRILIIQTAFLGDVILATPLIEALKSHFPESKIDFLLRKSNESLLQDNPHLNEVLIWDKGTKYKSLFQNLKRVRRNQYDLTICVQRYFNAGFLTVFSKSKETRGFIQNPWSFLFSKKVPHSLHSGIHEVDRNLTLIQDLVDVKQFKRPVLYPRASDFLKIEPLCQDEYYCLAPASVWFTKQLPEHKWVELIKNLPVGAKKYLLGAPSDRKLAESIQKAAGDPKVQVLCGELSLMQSACLMQRAKRNYVNDSGPLHLASSMNAPVTAFFCSTIPDFGFGPRSEDQQIVQVEEPLSCRPCGTHGFKSCPKGHFKCGNLIDLSQVKA